MESAILHFLLPVLVMRLLLLDKRLILLLSPLAVIPDFDYFIGHHRATTHNLFLGAILVVFAWLLLRKWFKPWQIVLVGSFFFLFHLGADHTGAFLYPVVQEGFGYSAERGIFVSGIPLSSLASPPFSIEFKVFQIAGVSLGGLILALEAFGPWLLRRWRHV
ncbi:MAG: hypothetical protein V1735_07495 [Nanoarchaeota archaeon]